MNKRRVCLLTLFSLSIGFFCQAETPDEVSKVRLKTNKGDIVIQLNAEKAPVTVANFKKYVTAGHYDGTVFHRVISDFMVQGGGFENKDGKLVEKKAGEGIVNESQNGLKNEIGTVAMARRTDPNSATAQFFINVTDNQSLNFPNYGGYAVFGKVIEGMDVVNQIKIVETSAQKLQSRDPESGKMNSSDADYVPVEMIIIERATLE